MVEPNELGDYFWRGGRKIPLEREPGVFSALVHDEEELHRLEGLPGVTDVKLVQNGIYRVHVAPGDRDETMERYRSGPEPGIAHHAYRPADGENTLYYLTDRITARFRAGTPKAAVEALLDEYGLRVLKEYPGAELTFLLQVTDKPGMNPVKVANSLAERREVEYAEVNLINRFQPFYVPLDTYFSRQWHLRSWNGAELVAAADVRATSAWEVSRGSREVVVAVIDDGVDLSHPDFAAPGKVVHPKDYVDGDSNPFPETVAGDYHGTPCAGVAVAEENGEGVVGVAPMCALMPIRFPLTADDDLLWEIFDHAGRHADVISCSWGPPPVYSPLSSLIADKLTDLATRGGPRKKGCVIVFAAGNYNAPLQDPENPDGFVWRHPRHGQLRTRGPILNGFAAHEKVLAASASTSLNRKAAYSNWGAEIDVCAPSNNFHPLNPNEYVPGRGIWTTDNERFGVGFTPFSRYTGRFGGTSSAAPLVAGIAALVLSANAALTGDEVRRILRETADKIVDEHPDPVLGRRGGTYADGERSDWFGSGKVNSARAVERAYAVREEATGVEELELTVGARGTLPGRGAARLFRIRIGERLAVRLEGPDDADFDLYLKRDQPPTVTDFDVRGFTSSSNEFVSLGPVEPGEYYVMVNSYRGSGDFDLEVDLA